MGQKQSIKEKPKKMPLSDYTYNPIKGNNDIYFTKIELNFNLLNQFNIENYLYLVNTNQNELNIEKNKNFINASNLKTNEYDKEIETVDPLSSIEGYKENLELSIEENNKSCLKTNSLLQLFKENMILAFIEKKITRNALIDQNKINDKDIAYFKNFYYKFSDSCTTSFKAFCKKYNHHKLNTPKGQDCYPKYFLAALGFVFCVSTYRNKLFLLFNILSNNSHCVSSKDFKLKLFMFILLSTPSSNFVSALEKFAQEDEDVRKEFPQEEGIRLYGAYEFKDIIRTMENIIKDIFEVSNLEEQEKILNFDEFSSTFVSKNYFWLFSSSGIRAYLERNNTE